MLNLAKQILNDVENNPTIRENRKVGMKVAVGYILDVLENEFFASYCGENDVELNEINNDTAFKNFCSHFCYDVNDTVEKRLQNLERIYHELTEYK